MQIYGIYPGAIADDWHKKFVFLGAKERPMENFIAYNPVKLYFGKNVVQEHFAKEAGKYGSKALIIIGKGSVKKYGYLQDVTAALEAAGVDYVLFEGVKPNPVVEDAEAAVETARREKIDMIIAVGGGSVIDTAKLVSVAYPSRLPVWDIMSRERVPGKSVPLLVVLTLAATGTEMNAAAVLQNHETRQKTGFFHPLMYPKVSFLDPQYTLTVPRDQTVNGIIDLTAHSLEAFFADGNATLSDRFAAANILEAMDYAPALLADLRNYELRSRMMWNATVAENGTTMHGRGVTGDWGAHALAHHISLLWDTPHGQTLSVIFPAWMKVMQKEIPHRLQRLARLLTGNEKARAEDAVRLMEDFFRSLGAPLSMNGLGMGDKEKQALLELWKVNKPSGMHLELTERHYEEIVALI